MIRIGIIGCGFMGGMHSACYQALGVQVTAVADPRRAFAEQIAGKCGARIYETGMELIEQADVTAVDICLPTDLHVRHAVAAMRKGLDVFVEKPVCMLESEMEDLLKAKSETGRQVQVGQVLRFWPEYVWMKAAADSGRFGRVLCGEFHRLSALPTWGSEGWLLKAERSGGVAIDMHVHDVDFVRWMMGEPDTVRAQAYRDETGLIQQIYVIYGYGKDVGVCIEAGWNYPKSFPFNAGFRVKFEKATVVLDGGGLTVYPDEGEAFRPELAEAAAGDSDAGGNISSLGAYYSELKYFTEGLRGEHPLEIATAEEAIRSVRLVKKGVESAGGVVSR